METQELEQSGMSAKRTINSKSGEGILKRETGEQSIPNLEENNEELEKHPLKETPFTIVGNEKRGWIVTMGTYKMSEEFEHLEYAIEYVETMGWEIIGNFITAMIHANNQQKIN